MTVWCQLYLDFVLTYYCKHGTRGALISFRTLTLHPGTYQHLDRGQCLAALMLIFECIPFWYTMFIEMTKKYPCEDSPGVDGVWTCQIIAIKTFHCMLKGASQIIFGGMGTILIFGNATLSQVLFEFCIVTFYCLACHPVTGNKRII